MYFNQQNTDSTVEAYIILKVRNSSQNSMSLFLHVENTFSKLDSWILHNKYQLATSAGAIYCDTQDDLLWSLVIKTAL